MDVEQIKVGIADYKVACSPSKIVTIGLGSCVGIALYDRTKKIGGLLHIMLPDSRQFSNITNPLKYPDLAIPIMLTNMEKMGARRGSLIAWIGGGACMFNFSDKSLMMDIGARNVKSVKEVLCSLSISIIGEDTGGNKGRTMLLDLERGKTYIKTINSEMVEI